MRQRRCFCNYRRVGIKGIVSANYLAGLGRVQAQLAGHAIDAVRVAELRFGETQLAVLLLKQVALLLLSLHLVSILNGAEMLPTVKHDADKQDGHGRGEDTHLAHTHRIGSLHQAGVVQPLTIKDLWGGPSPGTLLGREEIKGPLSHLLAVPSRSVLEGDCCDCLCRHLSVRLVAVLDSPLLLNLTYSVPFAFRFFPPSAP